ncbi:MAG: hypothetical protein ACJ75H_14930 [Thermoanaerobaculia bacterium]
MSFSQELWDTFRKLAALEARTEDVVRTLERTLHENVRNEILADIKSEMAVLKFSLSRSPLGGPASQALLPGEDLS